MAHGSRSSLGCHVVEANHRRSNDTHGRLHQRRVLFSCHESAVRAMGHGDAVRGQERLAHRLRLGSSVEIYLHNGGLPQESDAEPIRPVQLALPHRLGVFEVHQHVWDASQHCDG